MNHLNSPINTISFYGILNQFDNINLGVLVFAVTNVMECITNDNHPVDNKSLSTVDCILQEWSQLLQLKKASSGNGFQQSCALLMFNIVYINFKFFINSYFFHILIVNGSNTKKTYI